MPTASTISVLLGNSKILNLGRVSEFLNSSSDNCFKNAITCEILIMDV